jgi:hypothetical protein
MGSTILFHNGFGDYVINRGALATLAARLPQPVEIVFGTGPQSFLVKDLSFAAFHQIEFSVPNGGAGREFSIPPGQLARRPEVLVNLTSWEGASVERLRAQLEPLTYIWNGSWGTWHEDGPNAVELAHAPIHGLYPDVEISSLRLPPKFNGEIDNAVRQTLRQIADQGYTKYLALHLDSSVNKNWPLAEVRDAICAVLSEVRDACVLIVGKQGVLPFCKCHSGRVIYLDRFSLQAAMNVVARSTAFLGVDSCMMKVADVCGIPGAGLFATCKDASRWGYFWTPADHVVLESETSGSISKRIANAILAAMTGPVVEKADHTFPAEIDQTEIIEGL